MSYAQVQTLPLDFMNFSHKVAFCYVSIELLHLHVLRILRSNERPKIFHLMKGCVSTEVHFLFTQPPFYAERFPDTLNQEF